MNDCECSPRSHASGATAHATRCTSVQQDVPLHVLSNALLGHVLLLHGLLLLLLLLCVCQQLRDGDNTIATPLEFGKDMFQHRQRTHSLLRSVM